MAKTNSKVDTENEKSYLTIEEFNAIRKMDFPKDFLDFLEMLITPNFLSFKYSVSSYR